jgi:hypothetical protein
MCHSSGVIYTIFLCFQRAFFGASRPIPRLFVDCGCNIYGKGCILLKPNSRTHFLNSMLPFLNLRTSSTLVLLVILVSLHLSASSCSQSAQPQPFTKCTVDSQKVQLSINAIHLAIGLDNMRRLAYANQPNANGALSRNITAYFHVRFQMGISTLTTYAILAQNPVELEKAVKAIEYSFSFQKPEGDFQLVVPTSLSGMTATEADLTSGTAFFMSSLGLALSSMQESAWFRTAPEAKPYRERVERLKPKFEAALKYLLNQSDVLKRYDGAAPNRLFFNALAYLGVGAYLGSPVSMSFAEDFIQRALALQQEVGFFKEGTGYDSSYQGVALSLGWSIFMLLPSQNSIKSRLWNALACGTSWQRSLTLASGEISTVGNARVFDGGESFLGQEKEIAWKDTVFSFWYYFHLTQNADYKRLGDAVLIFYGK